MSREDRHPMIDDLCLRLADGRLGRRAFLRLATLLGLSVSAATALAGGVAVAEQPSARRGGRLTLGGQVPAIGDPHALAWLQPANIVHQVCEPLTRTGVDNITRPHLLTGWRVSPDLRTWDLLLRDDVTWRSGRRFLADDVLWNLRRILDPATGSSALGLMGSYMLAEQGGAEQGGAGAGGSALWDASAVEKLGDFHVRLNLRQPQLAVPEHLFHYSNVMLDPDEGGRFEVGTNGTGAFWLAEWGVGGKALLKARDGAVVPGGPRRALLDELLFLDLGDDPTAAAAALVSGQVDGLVRCDFSLAESLAGRPGLQVYRTQTAATAMLQMKVDRPPFDDARVRRAMRLALDVAEVTRLALDGFGIPAEHHLVAPVHPDYAPLPPPAHQPAEARALLAEAGYPDGIDITITCKNWPQWELAAVQAMAALYAEAGIRCTIEVMPAARFWEVWDKAPLPFVEWAPRPLGFMLLDLTVRSGVPWNTTGFSDPAIDDLLTRAGAEGDLAARRDLLRQVEIRMQEVGPMVQPAWLSVVTAMSERVGGFSLHPSTLLFAEGYFLKT